MNVCRWLLLCQLCTVMDGSDPVGGVQEEH
jgi:hypothetical protein